MDMDLLPMTLIALAIGVVAFLYSSVGHGGASGYIAVLTLAGCLAAEIKPTALVLNILVSGIGAYQFWRAGYFSWSLFWPFAALAIPAAYAGGYVHLPIGVIHPLLGVVLLASAARLFWDPQDPPEVTPPRRSVALSLGAGIGFLSGLTGTGGGIFLTPLLLLRHWAITRQAAAVSATFIFVNSISGLTGHVMSGRSIPMMAGWLSVSAVLGGTLGSYLGSRRLSPRVIRGLLAVTLIVASFKLLYTR